MFIESAGGSTFDSYSQLEQAVSEQRVILRNDQRQKQKRIISDLFSTVHLAMPCTCLGSLDVRHHERHVAGSHGIHNVIGTVE